MPGEPPVRGFATLCCLGDYCRIATELLTAVTESRLYERMESLDLAVLGPAEDQEVVAELIRPFEKVRIGYRSTTVEDYEFPALGLLQDACRTWSGLVFYLHGKGVSRSPLDQHARYWRAVMLDEVVRDHAACIDRLVDHDLAGTNWRWNHFSGNFWWARADYVRRLPDIRGLRRRPPQITSDPVWNLRLQCEFWIGMGAGRSANLGVRDLDLDRTFRWNQDVAGVVNQLLAALAGDRYAEIVIDEPSPYRDRVQAQVRDSFGGGTRPQTGAAYDVVLVDGWHEEDSCYADIEAALVAVGEHGAVVVHDTNPPTDWHQRDAADFEPGSEWNGQSWRAVRRWARARPDVWLRTVDTDWGCTVILPWLEEHTRPPLEPEEDGGWEWFERRRDDVLRLVTPSQFGRLLHAVPFLLGRPLTTRTELLNCLVSRDELDRYLEIGVDDHGNFRSVIAPVRHGVDPRGATFSMTSDEFFASGRGCPEYDLVFIDGLHEQDQVLRDIENALDRLSARGRIVLHDANPPTAWHQRPHAEYQPGEPWNGTVWKAAVLTRVRHPELQLVTLDVDWGCAVLTRHPQLEPVPDLPADLTWEVFEARRGELLNLRPATMENLWPADLETAELQ